MLHLLYWFKGKPCWDGELSPTYSILHHHYIVKAKQPQAPPTICRRTQDRTLKGFIMDIINGLKDIGAKNGVVLFSYMVSCIG